MALGVEAGEEIDKGGEENDLEKEVRMSGKDIGATFAALEGGRQGKWPR